MKSQPGAEKSGPDHPDRTHVAEINGRRHIMNIIKKQELGSFTVSSGAIKGVRSLLQRRHWVFRIL